MEYYDSICEIKHGSTVLVALGDPMWAPVAINGQQIVDVVARVRAAGVKAFPRGNERNTLTFEKCDEAADIATAFKNELAWAAALPRTMAAVTITFADTSAFTLPDATVEGWSGGQMGRLGRQGLQIIGGKLAAV